AVVNEPPRPPVLAGPLGLLLLALLAKDPSQRPPLVSVRAELAAIAAGATPVPTATVAPPRAPHRDAGTKKRWRVPAIALAALAVAAMSVALVRAGEHTRRHPAPA